MPSGIGSVCGAVFQPVKGPMSRQDVVDRKALLSRIGLSVKVCFLGLALFAAYQVWTHRDTMNSGMLKGTLFGCGVFTFVFLMVFPSFDERSREIEQRLKNYDNDEITNLGSFLELDQSTQIEKLRPSIEAAKKAKTLWFFFCEEADEPITRLLLQPGQAGLSPEDFRYKNYGQDPTEDYRTDRYFPLYRLRSLDLPERFQKESQRQEKAYLKLKALIDKYPKRSAFDGNSHSRYWEDPSEAREAFHQQTQFVNALRRAKLSSGVVDC